MNDMEKVNRLHGCGRSDNSDCLRYSQVPPVMVPLCSLIDPVSIGQCGELMETMILDGNIEGKSGGNGDGERCDVCSWLESIPKRENSGLFRYLYRARMRFMRFVRTQSA